MAINDIFPIPSHRGEKVLGFFTLDIDYYMDTQIYTAVGTEEIKRVVISLTDVLLPWWCQRQCGL